ncbi:MAG: peptide chain release factor 1 [Victivallaceae bacterium]|jgi:peptide chain release factor 1|nr:peptide chain release factor 1 [Victivallaceae bacterium]NLK82642.1 peptide chain release factor 1 [Lentisphaerota bacterium]MDD3116122.1 peptide chain release factor 1 [Victivallaceae bacterium]MDD3702874.1 peptide chain release factor 1 [Victivallaceae bacterium]MDD4318049.1 peptide chain release factor 1 [Victivallaceae bacterium]
MTPEDIEHYIEKLRVRAAELEIKLNDPSIYSRPAECKQVSREHLKLVQLFENYERWCNAVRRLDENRKMLGDEKDAELIEMIESDIESLETEIRQLEDIIKLALLPPDINESRDVIIEIHPAAGGEEAALFAGELYRAYQKFADSQGWKVETLDFAQSDLGGIKNVAFSIDGDDVFATMKFESGVHRVQRVPATESGGRIHTSTVTVAVLAEAEEVELEIKPDDLRFDVFRSSGPGGQCVNTTDSAVRVTHIPTGFSVASQQEKSQHRNKEIAMRILRARLLEKLQQEELAKQAADKRAQVGTGDRSERIRTYNFPQNRVTDHRYNISFFDLPGLMEGNFHTLLAETRIADAEQKLSTALSG